MWVSECARLEIAHSQPGELRALARFGGRRDYDHLFRGPERSCEYREATLTPFASEDRENYLHEYYRTSLRCRVIDVLQPKALPGTGELESGG